MRLLGNYLTDLLDGDVRQRDRIPHLTDDDRAGSHARRVMEAYVTWFETPESGATTLSRATTKSPEVAFLELLGLFDRPAPVAALDALLAEPDIPGLTEGLRELDTTRMKKALNHLKKLGLLSENIPLGTSKELRHLPMLRHLESLDAHPLVREHFGQRLENGNPDAWREANARLYDYYRNLPKNTCQIHWKKWSRSFLLWRMDAVRESSRRLWMRCIGKESEGKRRLIPLKNSVPLGRI
ncbi:MAG: hypothetical protein IPH31_13245 [Lewinellaceae bacterium]|nr:hypothetical protein [Lewinellaceae bacterium]